MPPSTAVQKQANLIFFGGFLILCFPLLYIGLIYLLKIIGGCSGDFTVTSASTIYCAIPEIKLIVDSLIGFGFIASFFGLIIILPGLALFLVGTTRKIKFMYRRYIGGEKFIQHYIDVLFLLICIPTLGIIAWIFCQFILILLVI